MKEAIKINNSSATQLKCHRLSAAQGNLDFFFLYSNSFLLKSLTNINGFTFICLPINQSLKMQQMFLCSHLQKLEKDTLKQLYRCYKECSVPGLFFKQMWKKIQIKPETFMTGMRMVSPVALIKQGNFLSGFFNNSLILNPFL